MTDARPRKRHKSTGFSSQRFGACEICGVETVPDVWIGTPDGGFTYWMGHETCVVEAVDSFKEVE